MREVTILLAAFFAMFMTWRGYRRGALATVAGWVPSLLALGVLVLAVWREPDRFAVSLVTGVVAAVTIYLVGVLALRGWRRWLERRPCSPSSRGGPRRWLRRGDRLVGAGLGLLCSATACLGLACLVSTLPFAFSVHAETSVEQGETDNPPRWLAALSETCRTLADLSDVAVLSHVPRLREYGQEVRALVTILNSPPEDLKRLAEIHGLTRLQDLPPVKAALDDEHYTDLYQRLKDGHFTALSELVDSPITRELVKCPEIRELTRTLTPSSLARDLAPPATARDADSQ